MGQVMIKCPNTGHLVPTGMVTDESSFESSELESNSVQCAACGEIHTWSKKDATLADD